MIILIPLIDFLSVMTFVCIDTRAMCCSYIQTRILECWDCPYLYQLAQLTFQWQYSVEHVEIKDPGGHETLGASIHYIYMDAHSDFG